MYLGEKNNFSFSQNLPNIGGENCTVLGLRLMHRLAMSLMLFCIPWYCLVVQAWPWKPQRQPPSYQRRPGKFTENWFWVAIQKVNSRGNCLKTQSFRCFDFKTFHIRGAI